MDQLFSDVCTDDYENSRCDPEIVIDEISVDAVNKDADTQHLYNSCNHWINGVPDNYKEIVDKTLTKEWVDEFHAFYSVLNINAYDLRWMKEAANVSFHTGTLSRLHREEIDDTVTKYSKLIGHLFDGTKYFVRADNVSLKEGIHGAGPYTTIKQIIESLITCKETHTPIYDGVTHIKLYLLPWIEIDPNKEFRVFVHDGNITAISQQHLYVKNNILARIENSEEKNTVVRDWVRTIVDYFNKHIKHKIKVKSFCMDIALTEDIYFIEINPFGGEYSAGSSLFHWMIDNDKLCSNGSKIYCRYAV